jgi:DNA replication protein DnaC
MISDGPECFFYKVVDLVNRLETETRNGGQGRLAEHPTRMDFIVLEEFGYQQELDTSTTTARSTELPLR